MKKIVLLLMAVCVTWTMNAQTGAKRVYDEEINPLEQIDQAIVKAKESGKFVMCQVNSS